MRIRCGTLFRGASHKELIARARETNESRDRIDRKSGRGAPRDFRLDIRIATALSAIECGFATAIGTDGRLSEGDAACIAEGMAMLEDIVADVRLVVERKEADRTRTGVTHRGD